MVRGRRGGPSCSGVCRPTKHDAGKPSRHAGLTISCCEHWPCRAGALGRANPATPKPWKRLAGSGVWAQQPNKNKKKNRKKEANSIACVSPPALRQRQTRKSKKKKKKKRKRKAVTAVPVEAATTTPSSPTMQCPNLRAARILVHTGCMLGHAIPHRDICPLLCRRFPS